MNRMGERLTKQQQKQMLREQGCVNCGQPYGRTDRYRRIELDHYIAWGDLPENQRDDIDQLQPMCGRCNRYKNKYTYEQINLREIPNWPSDFDWSTLAWVDPDGWREPVPALWIHGEHFDVPIWPSDRATTDVPVHDRPQFAQDLMGREK